MTSVGVVNTLSSLSGAYIRVCELWWYVSVCVCIVVVVVVCVCFCV